MIQQLSLVFSIIIKKFRIKILEHWNFVCFLLSPLPYSLKLLGFLSGKR